ncbi:MULTISPECIES: TetR/AcrR family transcriptional regulator [unclassified Novosphingobium]|uniref:TetR/AcrR family transcriptional regulator n=1 Tax=unclassified Novosphingobium TaxID=2644732 RepID=UPI001359DDA8|nr:MULTISPECIES: TetR/AcrR family transcriptional regulator [unclassified Novosphingobium]
MSDASPAPPPRIKKPATARPTKRGRPSHEQSAAISEAILAVAAELFVKDGFDGTSMEAVANAAGIPKTTLYKRYADKAALVNDVIIHQVASWSQVTSRQDGRLPKDLKKRLVHHTTTMLVWTTKPDVRAIIRLALNAAGRGPQDVLTDFFGYTDMIAFMSNEIAVYGPASGIHAEDPERIAHAIMAMISGWLNIRGMGRPLSAMEARSQAQFIIDLLMGGLEFW